MKTPPNQTTFESAPRKANYTPGRLPTRKNTVTAEVIATLLESKVMTGMESVFKQSTTRLSAVIGYLKHDYGWHTESRNIAAGTKDGRVSYISAYWLPRVAIEKAFEAGARKWIDEVKIERAKRRKLSSKCKEQAAKLNAARKVDPRQSNLWEEF